MPYNSIVRLPAEPILSVYEEKEATLESLLWSLNVPLYILVAFELSMVSGLLVEKQRAEVAVLRSRGAGRWQIILLFAMESAALSAVALLVGPLLGAAFTAALGSSDSFMSFVQRKALPVRIGAESYAFAGAAAAFSFIVYLIPVFLATRFSIVDQKRSSARQDRASVWHRFGLDAVLLGLSLYGLYTFRKRIAEMTELGLASGEIATDPLLFAVPSMFILGFGLALLRLYPWFVKLVYWLGRSRWTASQYSSLLQVGRRGRQYQLLMMFLILTVGTGLFSASAARTINGNLEDQIWYANGADIVLRQDWLDNAPTPAGPGMEAPPPPDKISYLEPDFETFGALPGAEHAARVFRKENAVVWTGEESAQTQLVGIHTEEFGRAAWMKEGLLPYHFYDYLNLIAPDPRAVLVSRSLAEAYELSPGDVIDVGWSDTSRMQATVYEIIDFFPTFNPHPDPTEANPDPTEANPDSPKPFLVVGHLETIQNELAIEPYDVWIDLASPDDRETLYAALGERSVQLVSLEDTYEKIAESRSDPFRMAMNGVMSLGFLLSLAITLIGFLLYWVLALQGRTLQFGIFRAMGLTFRNIVGMLGTEQLLTSGAGFGIGLLSGAAASALFVPLFQLSFDPGRVVPPFQVLTEAQDTTRLLLFIALMLVLALSALAVSLRKIKLHQALKLGED
jgi:putative ABC transport system permease protein